MNIRIESVSFTGLLFLVFLTLKLCNVIQWSWVWVTAPLWINAIIYIAVVIIATIIKTRDL